QRPSGAASARLHPGLHAGGQVLGQAVARLDVDAFEQAGKGPPDVSLVELRADAETFSAASLHRFADLLLDEQGQVVELGSEGLFPSLASLGAHLGSGLGHALRAGVEGTLDLGVDVLG